MQVGGKMHVGAGSDEEAVANSPNAPAAGASALERFAVIHDEPFFTIVYDEGEFKGEIVDATIEHINQAMAVVEQYNLTIDRVEGNDSSLIRIYMTEKGAPGLD